MKRRVADGMEETHRARNARIYKQDRRSGVGARRELLEDAQFDADPNKSHLVPLFWLIAEPLACQMA